MLAIIDSGSTKTDWYFIGTGNRFGEDEIHLTTRGLNPYFVQAEEVRLCLEKEIYPFIDNRQVTHVYFFGSGCADEYKKMTLYTPLEDFFPEAEVNVDSDLMGAAVALFGREPGIAGILGTGASVCRYDGTRIVERQPSLGYILGDEGSGAYIGLQLLRAYLYRDMPADLAQTFATFCPGTQAELLDKVYKGEKPNRFLGALAVFAGEHRREPFVAALLQTAFDAFFEKQLLRFDAIRTLPVKLLGSVAYHFREELAAAAHRFGMEIVAVEPSPLAGLIRYYRQGAACPASKADSTPGR